MLDERGIFVIPDILAVAGGVTTSYFEWVQDRHGYFWEEQEVNQRLEAKMMEAFHDVLQTSIKYKTDMRTAGYIVAITASRPSRRCAGCMRDGALSSQLSASRAFDQRRLACKLSELTADSWQLVADS